MAPPLKPKINSHRDLLVWQRAMDVVRETYRVSTGFPSCELYGLTAQMRRAAVSIAANIAEGHGRRATRDYLRFLAIANGSLRELETYCQLVSELPDLPRTDLSVLWGHLHDTGRKLTRLRQSLKPLL